MRIAISGTAGMGKSTLIGDMLAKWKMYNAPPPEKTYRALLKENQHSSKTNEQMQMEILKFMVDQQKEYKKGDNIIFDRCPLDNLVYTMWACEKNIISDDVFADIIPIVRESMRNIDIIFLIEYDANIPIVDDGVRDASEEYILEIDAIFKGLFEEYMNNLDHDIFFPKDDAPTIIPIKGNRIQRILQIADYIGEDGDLIEEQESILDPKNMDKILEQINQQKAKANL